MADLEGNVEKLDKRVTTLEQLVTETTTNVNSLIREFKDFKDEMRQQNQMRAEEIREIRQDIKDMGKHVRNLAITSMAAVGGMVIAVGAMVATVIYTILKS